MIDSVGWLKAATILIAGLFGILGLLVEFKDDDKRRVTTWGAIALFGIISSTTVGFLAQILESATQKENRAEDTKRMLELLAQSRLSLTNIERSLSILDEPTAYISFDVDCNADFARYCEAARKANLTGRDWPDEVWKALPDGGLLPVSLFFQKDGAAATKLIDEISKVSLFSSSAESADWQLDYGAVSKAQPKNPLPTARLMNNRSLFSQDDNDVSFAFEGDVRPVSNKNKGTILSLADLKRTEVYLTILFGIRRAIKPTYLRLTFRNGRSFEAGKFAPMDVGGRRIYRTQINDSRQ